MPEVKQVPSAKAVHQPGGVGKLVRRWLAAAHPLGTPLEVGEPGETPLSGTFAGLTSDGALQLRLADGTTRTIHAGEVRLA